MKNVLLKIIVGILIFAFMTACSKQSSFDGSRTGNNEQFIMEYNVLNDTQTHEMELEQGVIIDVTIENIKGRLDVIVANVNGGEIYRGNDASSGHFLIEIPKTGTYLFTVTGSKAKGGVSFKIAE